MVLFLLVAGVAFVAVLLILSSVIIKVAETQ